jgi:hypothetical protein
MRNEILAVVLLVAGCSPAPQADDKTEANVSVTAANVAPPVQAGNVAAPSAQGGAAEPVELHNAPTPVEPPAPGTPGGLPDDRTPISEAPFAWNSAQAAANMVQTYFALLDEHKYAEAWKLWSDGGKASGMTAAQFAASFAKYAEYHAQVGAPGEIEGAAGSSYVEVPVVVYGRLKSGEEVHMKGAVTLRHINDVTGATAEQRKWHIASTEIKPRPR